MVLIQKEPKPLKIDMANAFEEDALLFRIAYRVFHCVSCCVSYRIPRCVSHRLSHRISHKGTRAASNTHFSEIRVLSKHPVKPFSTEFDTLCLQNDLMMPEIIFW